MSELFDNARQCAEKIHRGQKDKGGEVYLTHPIRVAGFAKHYAELYGVDPQMAEAVGLLHDVLEDAGGPIDLVQEWNIPAEVAAVVALLTRAEWEDYAEYIKRVLTDRMACVVKLADTKDNLDPVRLAKLPKDSRNYFVNKYTRTQVKLLQVLEEQ